MADSPSVTKRQHEILDYIRDKIENRGFPPSIREIGEAFQIASPNGVMCHLKALEKKGCIERNKGVKDQKSAARAITIPGLKLGSSSIPMLGLVAAGTGLEAVRQDERLDLGDMFSGKDHYALKVRGQSMIEDHIDDGDIVIVRRQETADNGDRVVAMIDGTATLKKFYRRKERVVLEPANNTMDPIVLEPGQNASIVGVLIGVVRRV
ncbi:MAG TPA: transcriptional repressor LexA [Gemmataceae bacterium]|jgi:repressor LexA|nr:transcriptional repressor LexA [Gemmataceae bacterium]